MLGEERITTKVYACRLIDEAELMKSSSGGMFVALSDHFLAKGDAVICASYDYNEHITEFKMIHNQAERDQARGSKYMQSKPGEVFAKSIEWLRNHPKNSLLFVGMGCQAEGFRKYSELNGYRDRVTIVDIICHGVPSPQIWKDYVLSLEKKCGKIEYVTFKDKRYGWKSPTALAKTKTKEINIDDYVRLYYQHCILRPSCHECPFAKVERETDITIGDYWHIEERIPDFYNSKGNSLLLIHTVKGNDLFDAVKDSMVYYESNRIDCRQNMLEKPTPISPEREAFWIDYNSKGIDYVMKKYARQSIREKIRIAVKKKIGGGYFPK